jgi:hypothetical protein
VSLQAGVAGTPGDPTPTGTVEFFEGASSLGSAPLTTGTASTSITGVTVGAHTYHATYTPTAGSPFTTSTSTDQVATVSAAPTTTLTASATGQTVALQAGVAGGPGDPVPTGSVEFFDVATSVGTATLSAGSGAVSLSGIAAGQHVYHAVYTPAAGSSFTSSISPDQSVIAVAPPPAAPVVTTTKLTAPRKVTVGRKATITVSVTAASGAAGGTVSVTVNGKTTTLTLVNGQAKISTKRLNKPGKITISAAYAATGSTQASSATATIKVTKKK